MATDHHAIIEAIGSAASSVVDGLSESDRLLDPRTSPATRLHKLFSVTMQTKNTRKYRDHKERRMRLDAEATVRTCWRLNPKNEAATQRTAFRDEDNMVRAVCTSTRDPLDECRVVYLRTNRSVNPAREWLFADVVFSVEFDRSLTADVA